MEGKVNTTTAAKDPEAAREWLKRQEEKAKPCPLCKESGAAVVHKYEQFFQKWSPEVTPRTLMWPSFRITSCHSFQNLQPPAKEDAMLRLQACVRCGAYLHAQDDCCRPAPRCRYLGTDGTPCGERHLIDLHGCAS